MGGAVPIALNGIKVDLWPECQRSSLNEAGTRRRLNRSLRDTQIFKDVIRFRLR